VGLSFLSAEAQEAQGRSVEGYITAVHAPDDFYVNGEHVTTRPETIYRLMDDKPTDLPLRDAVRVGAYVRVLGSFAKESKTVTAGSVLFREDWDKKLSGFGVIDKVISSGAETVYQADGYRIRITSSTDLTFGGELKTLADVGANTWIRYKGKRDEGGVLVAAQAEFVPAKAEKFKGIFQRAGMAAKQEQVPSQGALIDANGNLQSQGAKVRLSQAGGECGWHKVPGNQAQQDRVLRLGMSLVPTYQKQMAAADPLKISFRFYVVDEDKIRSDLFCEEGLILIPKQMLERLKNDDQVAALLADGIAFNLQRQSAKLFVENGEVLGAEIAFAFVRAPGVSLAADAGGAVVEHKIYVKMEEQRGRMALTLMADAGYDPWQAPEAWRLLDKKTLPKDLDSLKYPSCSGYQLGILNLQFSPARHASGSAGAPVGLR